MTVSRAHQQKPPTETPWRSRTIFAVFIALWLFTCSAIIGALSLGHVVALPLPAPSIVDTFKNTLLQYRAASVNGEFVTHILAADCSCTKSLTEHLLTKGPQPQSDELILYVGFDPELETAAIAAGFRYKQLQSIQLTAMGLESAPVMAVFDEQNNLNYLGGYYDHPAAIRPQDKAIRDSITSRAAIEPLPIFGCATSSRLQEAFDPLGIVY